MTRIRTFDNETITVPNTELATNAVTNRMSNATLRISTTFGIGDGDDIDETIRILLDAAAEHEEIVADPDREDFSVTRSEYIQTLTERCRAAEIDLSTTSQHAISGDITVEDAGGA